MVEQDSDLTKRQPSFARPLDEREQRAEFLFRGD
jgi:hypothetical protein